MWDFGSTKTVLLTVMSLPHSFSTYLEDIAKSVDHDLIAHDSGLDGVSPQPVFRKSDGLFGADWWFGDDSTRIKRNSMKSDDNLDDLNDEQNNNKIIDDETRNMDFASKFGIFTI